VFIPGIFFFGGGNSPQTKITICTQKAAKLLVLNLFFGRNNELEIYHGNFRLMDNKPRKLFAIKQSKGCKLPKMQQNTFGGLTSWGRADPWPQWGGYF